MMAMGSNVGIGMDRNQEGELSRRGRGGDIFGAVRG